VPRSIFITAEINMLFLAMGSLFITLASAVFVYLLAASVYSTAVGILLGVLALLPCINLIMLLIVNGKATSVLRAHGIKVGLLGAKL
jgi:hypothetical protein